MIHHIHLHPSPCLHTIQVEDSWIKSHLQVEAVGGACGWPLRNSHAHLELNSPTLAVANVSDLKKLPKI